VRRRHSSSSSNPIQLEKNKTNTLSSKAESMGSTRLLVLLAAASLLLATAVPAARAQEETDHEEEFTYISGDEKGPEHWGKLKPEWAQCGAGEMQSPIDLSHERVKLVRDLGYLDDSYRAAEASIVNRGHDIMVRFDGDAGSVVINGTAYYLRQLHWHSPTEHSVDGRRYDMELHMVHESAEKKAAVIGLLYEVGRPDRFLQKVHIITPLRSPWQPAARKHDYARLVLRVATSCHKLSLEIK
jgi:carbonic anhydrase